MTKKILVDVLGFGSFMLIIQFVYLPIEDELLGWQTVLITMAVTIPVALVWHYFYAKVRQDEE